MIKNNKLKAGFTIVELLIVIVIIGILAAITVVSYTGITSKANVASIQSDLANAAKKLNLYYVDHGQFPQGLDNTTHCPTTPADNNYCIKVGANTDLVYQPNGTYQDYTLTATKNTVSYKVTKDTAPVYVAAAQSFVKTWGGSNADTGYSLARTNDGGYIITGWVFSFGAGSYDMFVAKYDASGNLSWNKLWGGTGNDAGQGVIQANDGGYVVIGYTSSFGAGSNDMFLVKYDAGGNLSWNKLWGGSGNDVGQSIAQTIDGSYAVSGYTSSFGAGNSDVFLAKYDASGNLSWNKLWGGTGVDAGLYLACNSDGGCAITGYTTSFGAGSNDMFLVKYDAGGNLSWNRLWGGTGSDVGIGVAQTSDGGYAVTGYEASFGAGSNDMFLVKYDAGGNLSWNRLWGGAGSDVGQGIVQSTDGGYIMIGQTASFGAGSDDMYLVKYDPSGNFSWNKTLGGASSDVGQIVIQTADGGYAAIGLTNSYGAGSSDILFAKTNSSGVINNCASPMCQTPTATVTSPSATVSSPSATVTTPSATVTTPSATVTTPSATVTTVVAP